MEEPQPHAHVRASQMQRILILVWMLAKCEPGLMLMCWLMFLST